MNPESPLYRMAREDFRRARRLALLKEISARLRRKPVNLLPFEQVRKMVKASGQERRGLQTIPLDSIVGSVGRYTDFTRDFLPRSDTSASRWVRVKTAIRNSGKINPIDVYQIGAVYFVLDGNHRVSVARERGLKEISAYVTEIQTNVPLTPDTDFNDLILRVETSEFLEQTQLKQSYPRCEIQITAPGKLQTLREQILLQQRMSSAKNNPISFQEAAKKWRLEVYLPVIKIIRERGILRDFPDRTETDLYIWIAEHQENLAKELGWKLEPTVIATDLADQHGKSLATLTARLTAKFTQLTPDWLKTGPRPGKIRSRQAKIHAHDPAHLFTHMLMPLSGAEESWQALELGLRLAWREEAHLLGLHVVKEENQRTSAKIQNIRNRFEQECRDVGLPGEMAVATGKIAKVIQKHARLSDLIILHLAHPPENDPIERANSGIRKLIQQAARPILMIPQAPKKLERLLVAYNGGAKSTEALYAAAYFAGRWEVPLFVVTVAEPNRRTQKIIQQARVYLRSLQIPATFIQEKGCISEVIINTAQREKCDLIFMGGYSKPPLVEVVLGSPLDEVLRQSPVPVLICR